MTERDPNGKDQHEAGAKLDADKSRAWLMFKGFANALALVADLSTKGAKKYTDEGWSSVPDGRSRYMDAAMRHLLALGQGAEVDPGTGEAHLTCAVWNLLAVLELESREAAAHADRQIEEMWKLSAMIGAARGDDDQWNFDIIAALRNALAESDGDGDEQAHPSLSEILKHIY